MEEPGVIPLFKTVDCREQSTSAQGWLERVLKRGMAHGSPEGRALHQKPKDSRLTPLPLLGLAVQDVHLPEVLAFHLEEGAHRQATGFADAFFEVAEFFEAGAGAFADR